MILQERIQALVSLGKYILENNEAWEEAVYKAQQQNGWFTADFINRAASQIANSFLQEPILTDWAQHYYISEQPLDNPQNVGIVMAGNIPLVGFHDLLSVFVSGHRAIVKASSKDDVLIKHLVAQLIAINPAIEQYISFADMLKNCDAYIATGSNNAAGYFDYYFGKYPNLIRRNRTSVALLTGNETTDELTRLADDVYLYFGLGCRNVTHIYVPQEYDFVPLLRAFDKYNYLADHHKYKNNYDYNLAIYILNRQFYMSNPSLLLVQNDQHFSPIAQLNYSFYTDKAELSQALETDTNIQCIVGNGYIPFGQSQLPGISNYADGADTMQFLQGLAH
jgi:hypothetical protein